LPASAGEFSPGQMSWYQRKRAELGMFVLREFPTVMEECFQAPVEGAIYAAAIDKLRVEGAIRPLVHTAWDLGSPINTAVWYFQLGPMGEIRVIDCDLDLDIPPVERVAHMLAKGYLYGMHLLPHDAMQTQKAGARSLTSLRKRVSPIAGRSPGRTTSGSASTSCARCCQGSASASRSASAGWKL
jgi:hypothetical protein